MANTLDRDYIKEQIQVSDRELTGIEFKRNFKNILLLGASAVIVSILPETFGPVATGIYWIAMVIYVFYSLESILAVFMAIMFAFPDKKPDIIWKFIQILVSLFAALFYIFITLYIYSKTNI
jgi:hypothetical protein